MDFSKSTRFFRHKNLKIFLLSVFSIIVLYFLYAKIEIVVTQMILG